ncbi:hypothetical protein D0X99_00750 [Algoriphagus lacus]|uniref:Uncharacterized protein n=1 Tax=Algoriphagus lacus TaxID=2056311 RepID=A0A418PVZ9_9BACT|nr:hypothetical protein [Algoriphagus lacus]RIW18259.1 hypothetical protein D0X99_00750 [Algoriphagus lacus]
MSQFDFPRINFHGSVLFDVGTANNGRFDPLQVYDQVNARPIIPPFVTISDKILGDVVNAGYHVESGSNGNYVEISSINTPELYDQWCTQTLGTSPLDQGYWKLYNIVPVSSPGGVPNPSLGAGWIQPGYWNYYGDMSVFAESVQVTGVQIPDGQGGVSTYSPGNSAGCPAGLEQLLGTSFSFHQDFYYPNPKTSAMFCDVDSIGQTCTQLFIGKAGMYNPQNSPQKTYFTGKPCKATFNWLGLSKVLNWYADLLMPMSGSAYFYTTIDLSQGSCDPALQEVLDQYAGLHVTKLSVKIMVHEVYEVHSPDYSKMPTQPLGNNQTGVPKNPARAAISGSITPYFEGDMTTNTICRILKNPISANPSLDTSGLDIPTTFGGTKISLNSSFQLAPAFLKINSAYNFISLDLISTICEYGIGFGPYPNYSGQTSIPPFLSFENFDHGTLSLYFYPENGNPPVFIGKMDHVNDYNMATFLARGGVMDFALPNQIDWSKGTFSLLSGTVPLMVEDDYLILSDQQGSYAEQNQPIAYGYKSDGPGRGPVYLRVFYRGEPLTNPVLGVYQYSDPASGNTVSTPINYIDGMSFVYPVANPGCMQYVFAITPNQQIPSNPSQGLYFAANGYSITTRVLNTFPELDPYLSGNEPITWDLILQNVLMNYGTVVPIMSKIIPFEESNWAEPNTLRYLLGVIDDANWGEPYYMPVTRELSANQRALLQKWANGILSSIFNSSQR